MSYIVLENKYYEFKDHENNEEVLLERAVKMITQIFYHKGLLHNYNYCNADQVLKEYSLFEGKERRRPVLEEVIDVIQ